MTEPETRRAATSSSTDLPNRSPLDYFCEINSNWPQALFVHRQKECICWKYHNKKITLGAMDLPESIEGSKDRPAKC